MVGIFLLGQGMPTCFDTLQAEAISNSSHFGMENGRCLMVNEPYS
jgi:hypothetical protein